MNPVVDRRPKPYVSPSLTVHGDVGEVTRDIQMGEGQFDSMGMQGNTNFKTG